MESESESELRERVRQLEQQIADLERQQSHVAIRRGVRWQSRTRLLGFPLVDIANGPDPEHGELRGHARGIIAVGDIATGVLAVGGVARGLIAIGGVAIGGLTLGGVALGAIAGLGGVATGMLAVGGVAVGFVAIGGAAIGHFAAGGAAQGNHVLNAMRQDPDAVRFFSEWFPWVEQLRAGRP
ncbi:MAG: hypothetical protein KDA96_10260 [Planctomycetaceae bacterium]|nr:hypothetical protein [Planctomycetaceae bacterium]